MSLNKCNTNIWKRICSVAALILWNNNNCITSIRHIYLQDKAYRRNKHHNLASHTRGQAMVIIEAWDRRKYMEEKNFK